MGRPKISAATINELFGPGLLSGNDSTMDAAEMQSAIELLEKDDSSTDAAIGVAMDSFLHKIMPAEPVASVLPKSADGSAPSAEEIRDWCRKHLLNLRQQKPELLITIRKALAEMQGVVVDVRYFIRFIIDLD